MKGIIDRVRVLSDRVGRKKLLALLFAVGILLAFLPGKSGKTQETGAAQTDMEIFSVSEQEQRLEKILSEIGGAGKVRVMLTLKSGAEQILAENSRERSDGDRTGESEFSAVTVSTGSGTTDTVTVKYLYPEYLGAVIVAEGAGNSAVRLKIKEAVSAATGLGASRIVVTD